MAEQVHSSLLKKLKAGQGTYLAPKQAACEASTATGGLGPDNHVEPHLKNQSKKITLQAPSLDRRDCHCDSPNTVCVCRLHIKQWNLHESKIMVSLEFQLNGINPVTSTPHH